MSSATVRPAAATDVPRLLELYAELDELHRAQFPELFPATVKRERATVERWLSEERVGFFVAEAVQAETRTVVGFVRVVDVRTPDGGVLLSRRFGLIEDLAVTEGHRRSGIASALLGAAETWARERGIGALEVTVWAFNQAAQELYASQGFSPLRQYLQKTL